uniref:Uncharacterized protein n=1 Tax=Oryza punctata TaxID=4537 RepID=A0A0E0JWP0_ORYPU
MGGCFSSRSSSSSELEAAAGQGQQHVVVGGGGGYGRPQRRVRPSDEDGEWPLAGRRTVDLEAAVYIAKFHQYQSNCCAEHAAMAPPTPRAPPAHPPPA